MGRAQLRVSCEVGRRWVCEVGGAAPGGAGSAATRTAKRNPGGASAVERSCGPRDAVSADRDESSQLGGVVAEPAGPAESPEVEAVKPWEQLCAFAEHGDASAIHRYLHELTRADRVHALGRLDAEDPCSHPVAPHAGRRGVRARGDSGRPGGRHPRIARAAHRRRDPVALPQQRARRTALAALGRGRGADPRRAAARRGRAGRDRAPLRAVDGRPPDDHRVRGGPRGRRPPRR